MGRKKSKPEWQADALELVNALKGRRCRRAFHRYRMGPCGQCKACESREPHFRNQTKAHELQLIDAGGFPGNG